MTTVERHGSAGLGPGPLARSVVLVNRSLEAIPHALIALVARFAMASVFWLSGQTKVEGLKINIIDGTFQLGLPRLDENTLFLFREEYKLPFLAPEVAAPLATLAEHVFPVLLLFGLATRFSALALLVMTAVIQIYVYPGAYALHASWAACLLYLAARGGGLVSLDALIARRYGYSA